MVGTPLMPGRSVDTYLFAMYDEDLKPGPTSERSFGLFKPDLTMSYDMSEMRFFFSKGSNTKNSGDSLAGCIAKCSSDSYARSQRQSSVTPSPDQNPKTPVTPPSVSTPETPVIPSLVPTPKPTVGPSSPKTEKSVLGIAQCRCSIASKHQPGDACFEPNTVVPHAAYAMNLFTKIPVENPFNCEFSQVIMAAVVSREVLESRGNL
ncbi:hypothetical protein HAX54_003837 [Datura stramonium]|uniref:Glucan endo-1,3-beta-D-glucosidase n=1 Tax=Datura stramonium TaxID=4076 RepID=A0ABS8T747_DATST|nr:hypothetical protein [Datura stramonium]